jgi:hypothetical protein
MDYPAPPRIGYLDCLWPILRRYIKVCAFIVVRGMVRDGA